MICGFHNVLPLTLMHMFDVEELIGLSEASTDRIPFADIVNAMVFDEFQPTNADDMAYQAMFKSVLLNDLTAEEQRQFFTYATSYPNFPVASLLCPRIHIRNQCASDYLPTSSTCTQTILLPRYASAQILLAKLRAAIPHNTSFGLT